MKISNAVDNASDLANSAKRGGKIFDKVTTTTGKLSKYGDDAAAAAKKAQQAKNAANKAKLVESTPKINIKKASKSLDLPDRPLEKQNKNKRYTPQIEKVTNKYGLDLNGSWNIEAMPHRGRHPNKYHEWMLERINSIDRVANGDSTIFLEKFENVKTIVRNNPDMLRKKWW